MVTRLFPSGAFPTLGTFCLERARALAEHADVRVMVPTPWFPSWLRGPPQWRKWAAVEPEAVIEGSIRVTYPRYLSVPGTATWSQGLFMSRAVRRDFATCYGEWRPDIIDGHFAFPDGYSAVRLGRAIRCPTLVTCHGSDLRLYPELPITRSMVRWTFGNADRVISVSTNLFRHSIELGCPAENAVFLSNGVDPTKFALRDKGECRQRLGLPVDGRIGVYVGYLIDLKDQSLVLRALAAMRAIGNPLPLVAFVGDGPNRERLRREAKALDLESRVVFAGQRPHAEVADWMGAADWLLLASDFEGWPTVYFEAMSCGRPVITSNVSSAQDAVCRPEYGVIVEPRTPSAFAAAIAAAAVRDYDAREIRSYAETHSWSRWAERTLKVIDGVLEKTNA